jgi:hypothetical protein
MIVKAICHVAFHEIMRAGHSAARLYALRVIVSTTQGGVYHSAADARSQICRSKFGKNPGRLLHLRGFGD